jgi:hypothetical protein
MKYIFKNTAENVSGRYLMPRIEDSGGGDDFEK